MPNVSEKWKEIDWVCDTAQDERTNNFRRYCDWYAYNQGQLDTEREIQKVTSARTKLGWSEGKLFKRIASMPLHVFLILRRIDPEFSRNTPEGRKKMYAFLRHRPEFSVPQN